MFGSCSGRFAVRPRVAAVPQTALNVATRLAAPVGTSSLYTGASPAAAVAAASSQPQRAYTTVDLHALEYHEAVQSRDPTEVDETLAPLVFVHGVFGNSRNFLHPLAMIHERTVAAHGGKTRRMYALDLRNHGKSPHHPEMSHEVLARDVAQFLEKESLEDVVLVGHSLGGRTVMQVALHDDARLSKLVVVDAAPVAYGYPSETSRYAQAMGAIDVASAKKRGDIDAELKKTAPNDQIRAFLMSNVVKGASGGFAWRINVDALNAHFESLMGFDIGATDASAAVETLFLYGTRSNYLDPKADNEVISRLFPNHTLHGLDTGHWVHSEAPDDFARCVCSFADDGKC